MKNKRSEIVGDFAIAYCKMLIDCGIGFFCHIMHLNNVYVKAWLNPKKWKDDINQVNEEQIRMWRGLNADVGHAKSSSHG